MSNYLSKHNVALTVISTLFMILILFFTFFLELNEEREINQETKRFMTEWTTFNGKYDSNHNVLSNVNINDRINIKYMDPSDALDFIYNDTGIIFFGTPDNQESRVAIEELINTCLKNNIKEINYIDISRYETEWAVREDGIKDYIIDENYNTLLNALDEYLGLDTYKITINDIEYDTNSKRIRMPNVFAIKNGEIVGNYAGVGKDVDPFDLSGTDQEKLRANYKELIMFTRNHNI